VAHTNTGTLTIAADQLLTINGSGQVLTQAAGTLQINSTAGQTSYSVRLSSVGVVLSGSSIAVSGNFSQTSGTFNFTGGSSTLPPLKLRNVALTIGAASTGAANFTLLDNGNTLSGNIAAAQSLTVQGDSTIGGATVTASSDFRSAGTITLTSVGNGQPASLNITIPPTNVAGTLTNSGTVNVLPGTGGGRTLGLGVVNNGTGSIQSDSQPGRTSA